MKAPPPFDTQLLSRLPGSELIREGLDDAYAGVESVNALLVEIAAPRLREFGMSVPEFPPSRWMRKFGSIGASEPSSPRTRTDSTIASSVA